MTNESTLRGEAAIARFGPLPRRDAEAWVTIRHCVDPEWGPRRAETLRGRVEDDRVAELAAGAEPTEAEDFLWDSRYFDLVASSEVASVWDGEFWYVVSTAGRHPDAAVIDAAGPFHALPELAEYLAGKTRGWDGWTRASRNAEGEAFLQEVETLAGKAPDA